MPDRPDTELDKQISAISADFVSRLDAMAASPTLRAGLLRAAIGDLIWTIYHDMPDLRYELADELEGFPSILKESMASDRAAK